MRRALGAFFSSSRTVVGSFLASLVGVAMLVWYAPSDAEVAYLEAGGNGSDVTTDFQTAVGALGALLVLLGVVLGSTSLALWQDRRSTERQGPRPA